MNENTESLILACNTQAMNLLRKGSMGKSQELLSKAQIYLNTRPNSKQTYHLWAITYNNLGCLHKRKEEFAIALKYLNFALENEEKSTKEALSLAGIHLNISAIFSLLENHENALDQALLAKKALETTFDRDQSIWLSLVISYHSIGFEQEKLGKKKEAGKTYLKGWELAQDHIGPFHNITESIKKRYYLLVKTQNKNSARGVSRSKTPVLLSKASNISISENPERTKSMIKKTKRGTIFKLENHSRMESLKNLNTLDLLVNEIEIGVSKTDTSTEVDVGKNKVGSSAETNTKQSEKNINKRYFDKYEYKSDLLEVPNIYENNFEYRKNDNSKGKFSPIKIDSIASDRSGFLKDIKKSGKSKEKSDKRKIEKCYKQESLRSIIENKGLLEKFDHRDEIPDNKRNSPAKDWKYENIENIQKKSNKLIETENFQSFIQKTDSFAQTDSKTSASKSTQTLQKPNNKFRNIAAIVIQREWRNYKGKTNPTYCLFIKEITRAKADAENAISKVENLKKQLDESVKSPWDTPIPKRNKINREKDSGSSITMIQSHIRRWLVQKQQNLSK